MRTQTFDPAVSPSVSVSLSLSVSFSPVASCQFGVIYVYLGPTKTSTLCLCLAAPLRSLRLHLASCGPFGAPL